MDKNIFFERKGPFSLNDLFTDLQFKKKKKFLILKIWKMQQTLI